MKQICRQLRVVREQAEKMIKPLIDNRFLTKQGNGQYRNFIKPADIPAMPVMKADPEPAPAVEDKKFLIAADERVNEGSVISVSVGPTTTFNFTALESSVVDESSIISHSRAVEISDVIAKARANPVLTVHSTPVEKNGSLLEVVRDNDCFGPDNIYRKEADLNHLARMYHPNWFLQDDLVGLHADEVVFQMESVWPEHIYHGVTPLFTEEELVARRVGLGLQTVPCASCEQPMTPEDIRHLGHICSNCENLTYVDTDSTPHCAPDDLAAALAELSELKAKYARCEALGQLVAGADVKLQYLTGLRLFVKQSAPKGLFLLDEILADYHELKCFGGEK